LFGNRAYGAGKITSAASTDFFNRIGPKAVIPAKTIADRQEYQTGKVPRSIPLERFVCHRMFHICNGLLDAPLLRWTPYT
jgi:hypothetical protein